MAKPKVLVVDPNSRYLYALRLSLESDYEVITGQSGEEALQLALIEEPNLILLASTLPDVDGFSICQRIREFSSVPIVLLMAHSDTSERIKGFRSGADDCITKPFSIEELLVRIKAILRRCHSLEQMLFQRNFVTEELSIDFVQQRVFVRDQEIVLTATEYRLLCELVNQAGRIVTPEYLLEQVWDIDFGDKKHLVWQTIHRLRHKIESDPQSPRYIQTRPGMGYLFTAEH